MKTFKKVLGVVLTIAMLAGVFSMMASALAPDTAVDLYISTDKAVYSAGDTIIITVSQQVDPAVGKMTIAGTYAIGFPSAVIEFKSDSTDLVNHPFTALVPGYDASIAGFNTPDNVANTQGISVDDGAAWDSVFGLIVTADGTAFENTEKTDLFTYEMKIKDDAADGTYTLGFNKDAYVNYYGFSADEAMGGIYGYDDDYGYGTTANYGFNNCTFTIGAAGPVVTYEKTQLKLNAGGYDVQMRITSKITDSDFDTYFPNTTIHGTDPAPTANALTSVGIVAFDGAQADFDEAAAKALVIDGTAADGYKTAETDYISKADDSADGYFGAILRGSRAAFENKPVTFLGFAKYLDADGNAQVIFYEAAVEKTITTSYFGS